MGKLSGTSDTSPPPYVVLYCGVTAPAPSLMSFDQLIHIATEATSYEGTGSSPGIRKPSPVVTSPVPTPP